LLGKTGVSVLQLTAPSRDRAERIITKMFKKQLIADAQVFENNERMYMKLKKEFDDEGMAKMRLVTTDDKLKEAIAFVQSQ